MVGTGLHWTVLIGVDAGGWILGLDVQVGGDVIRHRLVFDAKTLTEDGGEDGDGDWEGRSL